MPVDAIVARLGIGGAVVIRPGREKGLSDSMVGFAESSLYIISVISILMEK